MQMPILTRRLYLGRRIVDVADFYLPFDKAANFPWEDHALWFYSQMMRWGDVDHSRVNAEIALGSYRPDLYREALKPLGVALPAANEGRGRADQGHAGGLSRGQPRPGTGRIL